MEKVGGDGMKWRTKWMVALMFTITLFLLAFLEERKMIDYAITGHFTTGEDLVIMKKWVANLLEREEKILVQYVQSELRQYDTIQPFHKGAVLSYENPLAIRAEQDGLIVYTGMTRRTRKTMTIMYDDGVEVTYGLLGSFEKLPYTSVQSGEIIATMDESLMYIAIEQEGEYFSIEAIQQFLNGQIE